MTGVPGSGAEDTFDLVRLAGGVQSLRSRANGQTFHPVIGPAAEARAVHVAGTRLVERANAFVPGASGEEPFTVWDVGLGAAANALAAVEALAAGYQGPGKIRMLSFDHSLAALGFALAQREALDYPRGHVASLEGLREGREVHCPLPGSPTGAEISWRAVVADFPSWLAGSPVCPAPHAVFYDPYSPAANPEMWTLETFARLHARLRADVPCLLTTYTRSTAVRVTLLLAGFHVGVGGASGEKDETTVATNVPGWLDAPLSPRWVEKKVAASTNAAPLRASAEGYTRNPIGEEDYARLRAHPQFVAAAADGPPSA